MGEARCQSFLLFQAWLWGGRLTVVMDIQAGRRRRGSEDAPER